MKVIKNQEARKLYLAGRLEKDKYLKTKPPETEEKPVPPPPETDEILRQILTAINGQPITPDLAPVLHEMISVLSTSPELNVDLNPILIALEANTKAIKEIKTNGGAKEWNFSVVRDSHGRIENITAVAK